MERTAPVPDLINQLLGPLLHPMVQDLSIDSHQAEYYSMGGDGKHLGRQLSWIQKKRGEVEHWSSLCFVTYWKLHDLKI